MDKRFSAAEEMETEGNIHGIIVTRESKHEIDLEITE